MRTWRVTECHLWRRKSDLGNWPAVLVCVGFKVFLAMNISVHSVVFFVILNVFSFFLFCIVKSIENDTIYDNFFKLLCSTAWRQYVKEHTFLIVEHHVPPHL